MAERKLGSLRTTSFVDVENYFPQVKKLGPQSLPKPDIFLTTLGFEKRAVEIPKMLSVAWRGQSELTATAIVGEYSTNQKDNELNRAPLLSLLNDFCGSCLTIDANQPSKIYAAAAHLINEQIEKKGDRSALNILFDISGASGNFILSAMRAILNSHQKVNLVILYAEAAQYFPLEEVDTERRTEQLKEACSLGTATSFIEYGVQSPEKNELYPGCFLDNRPDFVIAVPSYRSNRMLRCLQSIGDQILAAPKDNVYWIFGLPPATHNHWRPQFQRDMVLRLLREISGSGNAQDEAFLNGENTSLCSTLDYREIIGPIVSIADNHIGSRLSLIHMGSKMQSIGLAFALTARPEIAVTFARPDAFNPNMYSDQVGDCWQIVFDNLSQLIDSVMKVGSLKFVPATGPVDKDIPLV